MEAESLTPAMAMEAVRKMLTAIEHDAPIYQEDLLDFYAAVMYVDLCLGERAPTPPGPNEI